MKKVTSGTKTGSVTVELYNEKTKKTSNLTVTVYEDSIKFDNKSVSFILGKSNSYTIPCKITQGEKSRVEWSVSGGQNNYTIKDGKLTVSGNKTETVTVSAKIIKNEFGRDEITAEASCQVTVYYVVTSFEGNVGDEISLSSAIPTADDTSGYKFAKDKNKSSDYLSVSKTTVVLKKKAENNGATFKLVLPNKQEVTCTAIIH